MGKQDYVWSDRVRFGQLPKEERKATNKVVDRSLASGFDHTAVCTGEIGSMLACFEAHGWRTGECVPEIAAMNKCVDEHKYDPDPKLLARRWQVGMRAKVLEHFVRAKVLGRVR